jgi:hypothetical protein
MTRVFLAGAVALGTMTGAALAQSPPETSTTQVTTSTAVPLIVAPVTGTSSSTTGHSVLPDGRQTSFSGTSTRDSNGDTTETTITNTSYPLSNLITTVKRTTETHNGVAVETVTTTQAYPPGTSTIPPTVTTTTSTHKVEPQ